MRLDKPIEHSGYFWLPSTPDSRLPGTLKIDESGSCTLEVLGIFGSGDSPLGLFNHMPEELPRLGGLVEGGYVTLESCWYKRKNIGFGGTLSKSVLSAGVVLIGASLDESIHVDKFNFAIDGLDEWVATSGMTVEFDWEAKAASIHYKPPKETVLEVPGMKVSLSFAWSLPSASPVMTQASLTQSAFISVSSTNNSWSLDEVFQIAHRLTNFICLAVNKTVSIKDVTLFSNAITFDGTGNCIPIRLYYKSLPSSEKQSVKPSEMLFGFKDVQGELQGALAAWLTQYDVLSPAISLFLSAQAGAHRFSESRFLALAQAAETLHRRTSTETLMESESFAKLLETVIEGCPAEHSKWLEGRLAYGNELPLRLRLKRLMKPFNPLFGNEAARNSFIKKVCDTRNYLTHYDAKLAASSAKGAALIGLTMKIECLIQLQLMKLIGLPAEKIDTLAQKDEFKQALNPDFLKD